MADRNQVTRYLDSRLKIDSFKDFCPNGLQIEGKQKLNKLIVGVTANQALIDSALERNADGIIVHHGLFWKGDSYPLVGIKRNRIKPLLEQDINLWAYHLPLDCHLELGNNVQLAKLLGLKNIVSYEVDGVADLLWLGELSDEQNVQQFSEQIKNKLNHQPLYLGNGVQQKITTIAWCSGAAQKYIVQAKALGADLFFSGEVSEQTTHLAHELDIHYLACGHHATERYGVQALANELKQKFQLMIDYVDIVNPV